MFSRRYAERVFESNPILYYVLLILGGIILVAVGALSAYIVSQRIQERPMVSQLNSDEKKSLSADAVALIGALRQDVIVLESDLTVLRASAGARILGLVKGNRLNHTNMEHLVRRAQRGGRSVTENLNFPATEAGERGLTDVTMTASPLPRGRVVLLIDQTRMQGRNEMVRRDFVTNISHELKTPVGAIALIAETLAEDPEDTEAVRQFAPKLLVESRRLGNMIHDIIDLAKIQSVDVLNDPDLLAAKDIVDLAVQRQAFTAQSSGVELNIAPIDPDLYVWGNEDLLLTALRNLMDNAVRYSPAGARVNVAVEADDAHIHFHVVDNGVGISSEHIDRIFERFYRVDPARSRETGGTGLGLSLVKHIAADHGGTVSVWSRLGAGSRFTLVLPRAVDTGVFSEEAPDESPIA